MKTYVQQALHKELSSLHTSAAQREQLYLRAVESCPARQKTMAMVAMAAVFVMLALTGLAVSFLGGFVFLDQEEHGQLYSCAVKDESLYVLGSNGLWVYPPSGEQARQLVQRQNLPRHTNPLKLELLASEPMMLMDREGDRIWTLEKDEFVLKQSYAGTELADAEEHGTDFVWQDGMLFIQSDHEGCIYRAELDTGEAERLPTEHATRLAPYRLGELLALTYSQQQGTQVWTIDAHTGQQQMLCEDDGLAIKGVSYSVSRQTIYAVVSGSLSRWDGTSWQMVCGAALPQGVFFLGTFGDTYAAVSHEGVQFIPLDGMNGLEETIVIHGMPDSARYDHGFQQAFPGLTVARRTETAFDMEDAVWALTNGTAADLLHVRIDAEEAEGLWALAERLHSEALRADTSEMLPALHALVYEQNQLYALPSAVMIDAWKISEEQDELPPSTLRELLEKGEYQIGVEAFEGTQAITLPWQTEDYAAWLVRQAIRERRSGGLRFSDEAFISTLQALQKYEADDKADPWYHTVMSLVGYLHGTDGVIPYTLPPVIAPNAAPQIPAWVTVYVLNPASQHKAAAIQYLEYLAANRDSWEDALLKPAVAQPELSEWARERIAKVPSQRAQIEADSQNWEVLAENLTFYREKIVPNVILENPHPQEAAMLQIVQECVSGKWTAEECASRLETIAE